MQKLKLNIEKREKIFYYLTLNKSYREIGQLLGRNHTTISREIKRNKIEGEYFPSHAENTVVSRRAKCEKK